MNGIPKLLVLVGAQGSGKSSFARTFMEEAKRPTVILSSDDLIEEWCRQDGIPYDIGYPQYAQKARDELILRAEDAFLKKRNVIWDQTNINASQRALRLKLFPGYEKIAIVFEAAPCVLLERVEARAKMTGKIISPEIIFQTLERYEAPQYSEGFDRIIQNSSDKEHDNVEQKQDRRTSIKVSAKKDSCI